MISLGTADAKNSCSGLSTIFVFLLSRSADTADSKFFYKLRNILFAGFTPLILKNSSDLALRFTASVFPFLLRKI